MRAADGGLAHHRWVAIGGRVTDVGTIVHSDVPRVRELERAGQVLCPTCREPMRVVMGETIAHAEHLFRTTFTDHEPEDPQMRKAKRLVCGHLQRLFQTATVAVDGRIDEIGRLADVVLVTGEGGRLALEVQAQDMTADQLADLHDRYREQGIMVLWLLDSRRMVVGRPRRGRHKSIRRATLGRLETALVAQGRQLLYLDADRREITLVRPPAAAVQLARLGDRRLGRLDCLVRTFRLDQLRVRNGRFTFHTLFMERLPAAPALPKALQRRLDRRLRETKR